MSQAQKYRFRSKGHRREIVAEIDPHANLIDRESGTRFEIVGEVLPLAASPSQLPWAAENLRACGCSRQQLVQKDLNDCPYCDRRLPAFQGPTASGN